MISTKALLVIILVLFSAVTLKASVHYGVGMPGSDFVTGLPFP